MNASLLARRGLITVVGVVVTLAVAAALLGMALAAGYLRDPLIRWIATQAQRRVLVEGAIEVHPFSRHPWLLAERVRIGNPPWTPSGTAASIERLRLSVDLPWFGRLFVADKLDLLGATLWLSRAADGTANWQWRDPRRESGRGFPFIHSISVPGARLVLDDAIRHIAFDGIVSLEDVGRREGPPGVRLAARGRLNGREATLQVDGDPLLTARASAPYAFTFNIDSSGSRLTGSGSLPRPFDFKQADATFQASGRDLKDLYFLIGIHLVDTGEYHLSGKVTHRGVHTRFTDLTVTSGASDLGGTVAVDASAPRHVLDIDMRSKMLRLADFGARAAGREPAGASAHLLLSDAKLNPRALRAMDWVGHYQAARLDVGHFPLQRFEARLTIRNGVLAATPLTAMAAGGRLTARLKLDATTDDPAADGSLEVAGLDMARLPHRGDEPPPVQGLANIRMTATGHGRSLHEIAGGADGALTATVTNGALRASLAELASLDLRAIGLMASKSRSVEPVRCGVADFHARHGILDARTLVLDTAPVLISGSGSINLESERIDLAVRGQPKQWRIGRVLAPLLIRGVLAKPSIAIAPTRAGASLFALVDRGTAKDADCVALLAPTIAAPDRPAAAATR